MDYKFKIGDTVKIIKSSSGYAKRYVGDVVTIEGLTLSNITNKPCYHVTGRAGISYKWFDDELELVKPKFDIKDYPGEYVMHVTSEEQAKIFCRYMHWIGRKWSSGASYLTRNNFYNLKIRTCYEFNVNTYDEISWFKNNGFTILEFDNFDWSDFMFKNEKEFTKKDLKNGDVIKRRDGSVEIVCLESKTLICKKGWNPLDDVLNDLTYRCDRDADIIAVRRPLFPFDCQFDAFSNSRGKLVYERKEVEEMTLEEVCKALGKEIKIVKNK